MPTLLGQEWVDAKQLHRHLLIALSARGGEGRSHVLIKSNHVTWANQGGNNRLHKILDSNGFLYDNFCPENKDYER